MKHMWKITGLAALVLAALTLRVEAGKVKVWHHHAPADHDKAQRQGVVISSSGALELSRKLRGLGTADATHVWSVVQDDQGNLFAGTGEETRIYRFAPDASRQLVYTSEAGQVLSLAAGKAGTVYAGTGPEAQIVRIEGKSGKVVCNLPESYVWALAFDARTETLYAGTGPHGRIYRIGKDSKASVFYETKQDHVLSLVLGENGLLYAGTDKTGRIYRIDGRGKGFVLYQAPQSEVRTLLWAGGNLYAGTSATKVRESSASSSSESDSPSKSAKAESETPERVSSTKAKADRLAVTKSTAKSKEREKGSPASAPKEPGSGENSVYRISPEGVVREVFREKLLVLSLARQGNRLLVGTGIKGQLFEVDETTKEKTEVARLDNGQVLGLCRRKDGSLVVAAGDPGKLYVLEERYQAKGTIVSNVLDAKLVSRWGQIRWRADVPGKTGLQIAVRSGNVEEPDETWSDWSEEPAGTGELKPTVPAARYLQYRLTLSSEDGTASPAVKSLTVRYSTGNQAPEVTKVEVPDLSAKDLDNPKKLKFKWSATDANEDELRYGLYVKKDGWDEWVLLEEDLEKTEYEWDTTTTPSGVYRLKIVASDHADNDEKEALTGERISEPFTVCHTPPVVTLQTAGLDEGRMTLKASAKSPLVRIVSASFAVDGKKWSNVFPTDGLFDSAAETFQLRTEKLPAGTHVVVLRVQDAAGNVGTADVVFKVPVGRVVSKRR